MNWRVILGAYEGQKGSPVILRECAARSGLGQSLNLRLPETKGVGRRQLELRPCVGEGWALGTVMG